MTAVSRPTSEVIRYATTALNAAINDDIDAYVKAMHSLIGNYGGDGVTAAMLAWIDTLLTEIAGPDRNQKKIFTPAWMDVDEVTANGTGKIDGADDTPPEARWAGRLIAARANDDEMVYLAILKSAPQDRRARSRHINALVMTVALTIRSHRAGTATMRETSSIERPADQP